jgi:hypothetical protein
MTVTAKTPLYGGGLDSRVTRLKVDVGPQTTLSATITSNRGGTSTVSVAPTAGRTVAYLEPTKLAGEFFDVEFSFTGTLYGYVLETTPVHGHGY